LLTNKFINLQKRKQYPIIKYFVVLSYTALAMALREEHIEEANQLIEKNCEADIHIGRYGTCRDWIIEKGWKFDNLRLAPDASKDLVTT
jgi:hypothetical protein